MQHHHEALNNARKNLIKTWNLLRQPVPGKSKQNKCHYQNPTISASTFNNFFCNSRGENVQQLETEASEQYIWCAGYRHERTHPRIMRKSSLCSPQPVQAADVILAISKLKNTKSTGHDQIDLQHIKESQLVTSPYITFIINTYIVTEVFLKLWKHFIIPIRKSGDIEEPTNFK